MKVASKVIVGATLITAVCLAIVLALILVLLAELYCSLLLRWRHQLKNSTSASGPTVTHTTAAATVPKNTTPSSPEYNQNQSTTPLRSLYAQGVLHAPRNFLFPEALPCNQNKLENHSTLHPPLLEIQTQESSPNPHQIGVLSPTSPSTSFATSPNPVQGISPQVGTGSTTNCKERGEDHFVYISNPIYDNDAGCSKQDTPFETPNSSPSRLENSGSSGDDEKAEPSHHVKIIHSPPMSPMKKLPARACSVSLRDASSLVTSGSDSNSNNGLSSSSIGSPCTSPSW
ncbi:hypothetical protein V6N13_002546 [Hibiscus sabdariffa]|uniref:Uncharacterized protein n=1 Tax=Hibiscus sabdariffa TaxID=183260 RepID=A0ABR2C3B0_9ROSI